MATSYYLDTAGLESRGRQAFLSAPKRSRPSMGSIQPLIQEVTRFLAGGEAAEFVKLTTHLHLESWLRMSRAVPLLPLSAFVVWTATILPLFLKDQSTAQRIRFDRQVFISGTVRKCCVCYYTGLLFPRYMSRTQNRWYGI